MFTEEQLRRIIREEINRAFTSLAAEADDADVPYGTGEIEGQVYQGIAEVGRRAARVAHHAADCETRSNRRWATCDCDEAEF